MKTHCWVIKNMKTGKYAIDGDECSGTRQLAHKYDTREKARLERCYDNERVLKAYLNSKGRIVRVEDNKH